MWSKGYLLSWWLLGSLQVSNAELSPEALSSLRTATGYQGNTLSRARVTASKPNFEVGSSSQIKLSFGKKTPVSGTVDLRGRFVCWLSQVVHKTKACHVTFIIKMVSHMSNTVGQNEPGLKKQHLQNVLRWRFSITCGLQRSRTFFYSDIKPSSILCVCSQHEDAASQARDADKQIHCRWFYIPLFAFC